MTIDQLRVFVAVAERQHVTQAAKALNMTQSAASSAITALERRYDVRLFDRVGRGIELTAAGVAFFPEARRIVESVRGAEQALRDLGSLRGGTLRLTASQTIASYWLPAVLRVFQARHPGVTVDVSLGNTEQAAERVHNGLAELGFVEGAVDDPALSHRAVGQDRLVLVQAGPAPATIDESWMRAAAWVTREGGSGTRSSFAAALAARGIDADTLPVTLVLPSNEAVRTAVEAGMGVAALSTLVVAAAIHAGTLHRLPLDLPARPFFALRHRQRVPGKAVVALLAIVDERAAT